MGSPVLVKTFSREVRDIRKKLLPTLLQMKKENDDDRVKIYLRCDKLVAGKKVYQWSPEKNSVMEVHRNQAGTRAWVCMNHFP